MVLVEIIFLLIIYSILLFSISHFKNYNIFHVFYVFIIFNNIINEELRYFKIIFELYTVIL